MKFRDNNSVGASHNTLSLGTVVKGDLVTDSDFRLDGIVDGNIQCGGKIVLGQKGKVVGNIDCESAEIHGEVKGNIFVKSRLTIKAGSVIEGDLVADSLEIENNAKFNGSCKMTFATKEEQR